MLQVVVANLAISTCLRRNSVKEGHYSSVLATDDFARSAPNCCHGCFRLFADDAKELSLFRRMVALQFVNTSLVIVIASSRFESLFGFKSSGLPDLDWRWYRDVGTDLVVVVWLQ
jgi:hypothetical protein